MKTAEKLAMRLVSDLTKREAAPLPPIGKMARRYGVSYPTMWSAVQILKKKGVLDVSRGRRPRPAEQEGPADHTPGPLERMAREYRTRITRGYLRAGTVLPKIRVIAQTETVSCTTVTKALRCLQGEGLVHKTGKNWIVGPGRKRTSAFRISPQYVIVLVINDWISWGAINQPRSRAFMDTLSKLSADYGIRISPVFWAPRKTPLAVLPSGTQGAIKHIRALGNRYLGSVLAGSRNELPDIGGWIRALTPFSRPVVWFDRYDELREDLPDAENFFRCRFSELPAIKSSLDLLYGYGHRKVGYCALGLEGSDWQIKRGDLLSQAAREYGRLEIRRSKMFLETWSEPWGGIRTRMDKLERRLRSTTSSISDTSNLQTILTQVEIVGRIIQSNLEELGTSLSIEKLAKYIGGITRTKLHGRMPEYFRESTYSVIPVLATFLADPEITAVIAPNDHEAQLIFLALNALGFDIPERISLLSFDNHPELSLYPFSTIDFGFDHLGYSAFHLILGDLPIRRDRHGDVECRPRVIHRGSITKPNRVG